MRESIVKSTVLVLVLTVVAKIFGFFKSIIQASYFGASELTDAFNIANGLVSNILYMLTVAIAAAYVPIYVDNKNKKNRSEQFVDSSKVLTEFGVIVIFFSIILIITAPLLIKAIAPSYSGQQLEYTVIFFDIAVVGMFFIMESSMLISILNAESIYGYSVFASIINSVVVIITIVLGYKIIGIYSLALSVPLSYMAQFVFSYRKGKAFARITFNYGVHSDVFINLVLQSIPVLISLATVEINQIIDRALLVSIEVGAVTSVSYSATLYQFATNIICVPISTVAFTELSEMAFSDDASRFQKLLRETFRSLVFFSIPIAIVAFSFSHEIADIVYGHGNFSTESVLQTGVGLKYYALCILPTAVKTLFTRAFYSLKDTKVPMIIGVFEVALNITLSIVLSKIYGIAGVVGATAIASFVFMIVLIISFCRKYRLPVELGDVLTYSKMVILACVCYFSIWGFNLFKVDSILIHFILGSLLCLGVYFSLSYILREPTIYKTISYFQQRFKKNK